MNFFGGIMEKDINLKRSTKVGLVVSVILAFVGLGFTTYNIVNLLIDTPVKIPQLIRNSTNCVMFISILFYAFVGYKKPHGNMLRGLFFTFGAILALNIMTLGLDATVSASLFSTIRNTCDIFAALLIVYVSGRLNKVEKNKKLLFFSGVLLFIRYIMSIIKGPFIFNSLIGSVCPMIVLAALGLIYVTRYKEHKEAGLIDAPTTK